MWDKKGYVKANHKRMSNFFKGSNFLLTYRKTGLVTSSRLVPVYCLIDLKVLARWAQAIVNRLYWSIFTYGGSGKELVQHFTFFLQRIVNKHKFLNNIHYKRSEHEALSEDDASRKE